MGTNASENGNGGSPPPSPKRSKSKSRSESQSSAYQESVGFVLEQIGINMMAFIFTYPVSSFDSEKYKALYWFALALVIVPALLSCLPIVKVKNLRVFEISAVLFTLVTLVAIYFSYKDDVEGGGTEQVDEIIEAFFNMSGSALTNSTGPRDFANQLIENAYLSTKHLHTFIINIGSLMALGFTYMIVKCVKSNAVNLIGFLGSGITLAALGSVWYDTMKACLAKRAEEVNVLFVGMTDVFNEVYSCSSNFSSLEGASIAMLSFGCLAAVLTLMLVMVRSGVMTCIFSTCCCCFASMCGKCLSCATCGATDSVVGDAVVLLGVVIGMLTVSATHFTNASWSSKMKASLDEQSGNFAGSFNFTESFEDLSPENIQEFLSQDLDATSMREFLTGAALLLPATALMIRVVLFAMHAGCKCLCGSGNAKTVDNSTVGKQRAASTASTQSATAQTNSNAITLV